jgi:hypothetical protein
MKLPNADLALVEQAKVTEYLLNPAHRYGASKARFFAHFGFRAEAWEELALALREHGRQNELSRLRETGFGPRYEVEGELAAPDGRRPRVCTVWQLDQGQTAPRLITAYPLEANQ